MIKFSERLKELRETRGLTVTALAKEIDVTYQAILLWENCERIPNALMVVSLADFFGVTTDYLLGRTD